MKTFKFDGRVFSYRVADTGHGDTFTDIYEGTELKTYRRYWLFGKIETKEQPKFLFRLGFDIEDKTLTKSFVRGRIEHNLELLVREAQIKRGEIV